MKFGHSTGLVPSWSPGLVNRVVGIIRLRGLGAARTTWRRLLNERQRNQFRRYLEARRNKKYLHFFRLYQQYGVDEVVALVLNRNSIIDKRARILFDLSRMVMRSNVQDAACLIKVAVNIDSRSEFKLKCAFAAWDNGCISMPWEVIKELPKETLVGTPVLEKWRNIEGAHSLHERLPIIPRKQEKPSYKPRPRVSMYVASSSRPYHVTGYTSRSHHLIQAIQQKGWEVHCVTRPGYPLDRPDAKVVTDDFVNEIDGVRYERLKGNHRRQLPYDEYLKESAERIADAARRIRPSIIHAASNYEAGLPALIAARKLGIPFVYEVRGLWEYTAASKKPGWENTERFDLDRRLDSMVSRDADHVFTLTQALANELVARGVVADQISLLPNAIDPEKFVRIERDEVLAKGLGIKSDHLVIGYVGSIVAYEGLDDLIAAVKMLKQDMPCIRLVIVGDGDARLALQKQARETGLEDQIIFAGRVPPDEIREYFSLFDLSVLPRKPLRVCELVSPLKPLESMAMAIPLLVSNVPALSEMVGHGRYALVHAAGDASSIAANIRKFSENPKEGETLALRALVHVRADRAWSHVVEEVVRQYSSLVAAEA